MYTLSALWRSLGLLFPALKAATHGLKQMKTAGSKGTCAVAIVLYLMPSCLEGQQHHRTPVYRDFVNDVLVPVIVTDRRGSIVSGLGPTVFSVLDNNVTQRLLSINEEEQSVSIGIILDISGSMTPILSDAKSVVRNFLQFSNIGDQVFLYGVSTRLDKIASWTVSTEGVTARLALTDARGSTALLDAIHDGLDAMRTATHRRKALLIVSDGMDNHSRYSMHEVTAYLRESDTQLFAIAADQRAAFDKAIPTEEKHQGLIQLEALADSSGGFSVVARNQREMEAAAQRINNAIRSEYLLSYAPQHFADDGKWHSIRVRLHEHGLRAHARRGYFAQ